MLWLVILGMLSLALYLLVVVPKWRAYRSIADIGAKIEAANGNIWQRISLQFSGLKTAIIGFVGTFVTLLPQLAELCHQILVEFHDVDFSPFFSAETALRVSGLIMLAMVATHAFGLVFAAKIDPKKDVD